MRVERHQPFELEKGCSDRKGILKEKMGIKEYKGEKKKAFPL